MAQTRTKTTDMQELVDQDVVVTRVFNAPREDVFDAWKYQDNLKRWWGPKTFTSPYASINFRVGGRYLYAMRSSDGHDFWNTGTYQEIVEPELILTTDSFSDEVGNVVPATYYGLSPDYALASTMRVSFEDLGVKTRITLRYSGAPIGKDRENMIIGWNQSFDKLAELVENYR